MAFIREVTLGWDTSIEPTEEQFNATSVWFNVSRNRPAVTPFQLAKLHELIRRFKTAHPEIWPNC